MHYLRFCKKDKHGFHVRAKEQREHDRKASVTIVYPLLVFAAFTIFMLIGYAAQFPRSPETRNCSPLPTPTGNVILDGLVFVGAYIAQLLSGCGPTWVVMLVLVPIAIAVILYVAPIPGKG